MRVLFLTPWYPDTHNPNHGIFVREQMTVIGQAHEVCVVAARIDYTSFKLSSLKRRDSAFQGISESRLVVKRSLPIFNQINFFVRVFYESYKIARKFSPDVIHGNIGYPGAFWAWGISKMIKRPFVVTEHTRIVNNFRSRIHKALTLFSLRRANAVIAVSQVQAGEINKFTGKAVSVVPNIINFSKFEDVLPIQKSTPVHVGFLGGMNTNVKGLDILLEALSTMPSDFILHIGGKGSLLEQYRDMAKNLGLEKKCIFYGFVSHDEVPRFLSRLHFFVSASRYETFGIAIVEALAVGLPVVTTNSGGPADFITDSNGKIVPVGDVQRLGSAIAKMLSDYYLYDAQAIRRDITSKFSATNFTRQINAIYMSLLEG